MNMRLQFERLRPFLGLATEISDALGEVLSRGAMKEDSVRVGYKHRARLFFRQASDGLCAKTRHTALDVIMEIMPDAGEAQLRIFASFVEQLNKPRKLTADEIQTARLLRQFFGTIEGRVKEAALMMVQMIEGDEE